MQQPHDSTGVAAVMMAARRAPGDTTFTAFMAVVLCAILCITLARLLGSYFWSQPTIHFVLPAGFNGSFVVVARCNEIPHRTKDVEYELRIPHDGVLLMENDDALLRWHDVVVSTTDGEFVRVKPDPASDRIAPTKVFLSKGVMTSNRCREHWFFIGISGEANDASKEQALEARLSEVLDNVESQDDNTNNKITVDDTPIASPHE